MLRLTGVRKTFNPGQPNERKALCGVSLALASGEFAVIIGSNGAGKSTLLNAIAGEFPLDEGTVEIDGADVTALPAHQRSRFIARVFQDPSKGTAPGMTVEENLALAEYRGRTRSFRMALSQPARRRYRDALAPLGLGLEGRLEVRVEMLSGGQRQALALVMAILIQPHVLILDEHCAALDPRTATAIMESTVGAVQSKRITTLMVTHNMQHAIAHGDRLMMMHEGQVLLEAAGNQKAELTVENLVSRFHLVNDQLLLST